MVWALGSITSLQVSEAVVGREKNSIVGCPSNKTFMAFKVILSSYSCSNLAVSEVLRTLIDVYKEVFKAPILTDVIMLQNYPQTILTIDEVCKEVRLVNN